MVSLEFHKLSFVPLYIMYFIVDIVPSIVAFVQIKESNLISY